MTSSWECLPFHQHQLSTSLHMTLWAQVRTFGQRDFQKWKCWVRQFHSPSSSRSALETRISKQAAQWGGVESTSPKTGKWARDGKSNQRRLGWDGARHRLVTPGARELGYLYTNSYHSSWAEPGREVLGPQRFWPAMLAGGSGRRCWWPEVNRGSPKWQGQKLPDGPVVGTPHLHCQEPAFNP